MTILTLLIMTMLIQIAQSTLTVYLWRNLNRKYHEISEMNKAVLEDNDDLHTLLEEFDNK